MKVEIPYYEDTSRISRSSLNWFKVSPRYFKDKLDGLIPNETSSAMENGTMKHAYLLQQDEFKKMYRILDFGVPTSAQQKQFCLDYIASKATTVNLKALEAFKSNYSISGKTDEELALKGLEMALKLKSYIKWLRGNETGQKTMTWAQLNSLKKTKENVILHKKANELLFKNGDSSDYFSQNEFHINWEIPIVGGGILQCKSLLDRIVIDYENKIVKLIDIKTTISNADFTTSFKKYGYGMQMAFYWMAIVWYFKNELNIDIEEFKNETYIIAIENGSNEVRVFDVPENTIIYEIANITQTLSQIDWHMRNNLWNYSREYYDGDGTESLLYDI